MTPALDNLVASATASGHSDVCQCSSVRQRLASSRRLTSLSRYCTGRSISRHQQPLRTYGRKVKRPTSCLFQCLIHRSGVTWILLGRCSILTGPSASQTLLSPTQGSVMQQCPAARTMGHPGPLSCCCWLWQHCSCMPPRMPLQRPAAKAQRREALASPAPQKACLLHTVHFHSPVVHPPVMQVPV